jgi:hypothetical protein
VLDDSVARHHVGGDGDSVVGDVNGCRFSRPPLLGCDAIAVVGDVGDGIAALAFVAFVTRPQSQRFRRSRPRR